MAAIELDNCQGKRFVVPVGLKCLLEEMSREVLKNQPDNINLFLANYLEQKCRKQYGPECNKNACNGTLPQSMTEELLPTGGDTATGTTQGYPKISHTPFGVGPDEQPILGPSRDAPFGYGPDGNPLNMLDPRAPNGYGPDGKPLPGIACVAPFGYDQKGNPLKSPDPYAPYGYHLSDGLPVATNDPTAPFGFGPDGTPLATRDTDAPLGYNMGGLPNTFPETVSFCGDKDYQALEGILSKAQSVVEIVQRIEQRDQYCGDTSNAQCQDAQIQAGSTGSRMQSGQPFAGDANQFQKMNNAGLPSEGINQPGQQITGMEGQTTGKGQQMVLTGQQMGRVEPVEGQQCRGGLPQISGIGQQVTGTQQQTIVGRQQGQNCVQLSGECTEGGVVFIGGSGANLLMSCSPANINIPDMGNAVSCGMQMGNQIGNADCAGVMRTAMDCMLSRIMALLSGLTTQSCNNSVNPQLGNVPGVPNCTNAAKQAFEQPPQVEKKSFQQRNKTGTTGDVTAAVETPLGLGEEEADGDDDNFGFNGIQNVGATKSGAQINPSKCQSTAGMYSATGTNDGNRPTVLSYPGQPAQADILVSNKVATNGGMEAPLFSTAGINNNAGGIPTVTADLLVAGAVQQPNATAEGTNILGSPTKTRQRCIPTELWQYVPVSGGGSCPVNSSMAGTPSIPPRQSVLSNLQITRSCTEGKMGEYVADILNRAQDIVASKQKSCAGSASAALLPAPSVTGTAGLQSTSDAPAKKKRPVLCGNSGVEAPTGPGSMGKYLQEIAPQYQEMFASVLTPEDQTTITLLTTVGTLLDTIEETGLTRFDPAQLCSDQTLKNLTEVGDKLLEGLKEHLTKMKSTPEQRSNVDPHMEQITREALDALDIGAESLDVAVGLLKDVTNLCGELAEHPELMKQYVEDLQTAQLRNHDQYKEIASKQADACQKAQALLGKESSKVVFAEDNSLTSKSPLDNELVPKDESSAVENCVQDTGVDPCQNQLADEATGESTLVKDESEGPEAECQDVGENPESANYQDVGENPELAEYQDEAANTIVPDKSAGFVEKEALDVGNQEIETKNEPPNPNNPPARQDNQAETDEPPSTSTATESVPANIPNNIAGRGICPPGQSQNLEATSSQLRTMMASQINSVHKLLTGEGTTPGGRIVFLTVSFVVGMVVGYAVARAFGLFGSGGSNDSNRGLIWASPNRALAACSTTGTCSSGSCGAGK